MFRGSILHLQRMTGSGISWCHFEMAFLEARGWSTWEEHLKSINIWSIPAGLLLWLNFHWNSFYFQLFPSTYSLSFFFHFSSLILCPFSQASIGNLPGINIRWELHISSAEIYSCKDREEHSMDSLSQNGLNFFPSAWFI